MCRNILMIISVKYSISVKTDDVFGDASKVEALLTELLEPVYEALDLQLLICVSFLVL